MRASSAPPRRAMRLSCDPASRPARKPSAAPGQGSGRSAAPRPLAHDREHRRRPSQMALEVKRQPGSLEAQDAQQPAHQRRTEGPPRLRGPSPPRVRQQHGVPRLEPAERAQQSRPFRHGAPHGRGAPQLRDRPEPSRQQLRDHDLLASERQCALERTHRVSQVQEHAAEGGDVDRPDGRRHIVDRTVHHPSPRAVEAMREPVGVAQLLTVHPVLPLGARGAPVRERHEVPPLGVRKIVRHDLGPAPLHVEAEETVGGADLQHPFSREVDAAQVLTCARAEVEEPLDRSVPGELHGVVEEALAHVGHDTRLGIYLGARHATRRRGGIILDVPPDAHRRGRVGRGGVRLSIPAVTLRVVPVALAAAVYWPITANYFFADDFLHLYQVDNEPLAKLLVTPFGGHLYTVSNLAFTLLYRLFGPEPRWYFCAVLLTHLVNVALLQEVVLRLGAAPRAAAAGAALWGTAPVLEGSLGWFSVYGHVLVATALLGVFASVARVASGKTRASPLRLAVWYVVLLAGATCFGTGIAVALVFPVVAFLLLPPGRDRRRSCAVLVSLWVVVPLLYLLSHRIWVEVYGGPSQVLPIQIALALSLRAPAEMLGGLLAQGVASTHLGFFWQGKTGSVAVLMVTTGVYLACVVAALGWGSDVLRRQVLACAVLSLAIYGLIAVGRGNLYAWAPDPEATPFRMAATSRYHYVA